MKAYTVEEAQRAVRNAKWITPPNVDADTCNRVRSAMINHAEAENEAVVRRLARPPASPAPLEPDGEARRPAR